nr:hypothetical protein [Tanacetum cinerariifolium]
LALRVVGPLPGAAQRIGSGYGQALLRESGLHARPVRVRHAHTVAPRVVVVEGSLAQRVAGQLQLAVRVIVPLVQGPDPVHVVRDQAVLVPVLLAGGRLLAQQHGVAVGVCKAPVVVVFVAPGAGAALQGVVLEVHVEAVAK